MASDDASEPLGWLREVVLDCADPRPLARFWSQVLGGEPVEWYDGWVTLEPPPHGQRLSFQAVPEFRSPTWPSADVPAQVHVDVYVHDLDTADQRVRALGALPLAAHVSPRPGAAGERVRWQVYADPAGHPFCLVVR